MGWNGVQNGALLKLLINAGFDALLTFDKNLQYQQNFKKYTIKVFVFTASINTYLVLSSFTPKVNEYLKNIQDVTDPIIIISAS